MINFNDIHLTIDCALPFSWKKGKAYARPRSYAALSFRVKGNADYESGKIQLHANTNDILFVPAKQDYIIDAKISETVLVVHFFSLPEIQQNLSIFHPSNPDIFQRLFSEICEIWKTQPTGFRYRMYAILYKIFEQIEIQETKQKLLIKPKKFQEAIDYLHENFSSPEVTVESTAAHIGISTVYLRKLFRSILDDSPLHYLIRLRLNHAQSLLKTGYYSITETALLSGFNDPKYFSLLYKKYLGTSPSNNLKRTLIFRD